MNAAGSGRKPTVYKLHLHVVLVHFPISFFVSAFTFRAHH